MSETATATGLPEEAEPRIDLARVADALRASQALADVFAVVDLVDRPDAASQIRFSAHLEDVTMPLTYDLGPEVVRAVRDRLAGEAHAALVVAAREFALAAAPLVEFAEAYQTWELFEVLKPGPSLEGAPPDAGNHDRPAAG